MPCLKIDFKLVSEEERGEKRDKLKVELGKLITSVPTTPNEVKTQVQQPEVERK